MPESLKVLAQLVPSANTLTDFYTVPNMATVSSLVICNQDGANLCQVNVSIAVAGASDDPKQYLYFELAIPSLDTFIATIGVTLGTGDIVRVLSTNSSTSFNLFGVEVSP